MRLCSTCGKRIEIIRAYYEKEYGNYGGAETMKSLEYMLESVVDFIAMLKKEATNQEEINLIKKYTKKINEM